tara:strand:- start:2982 stop:3434 length:453 start_codon:yes stop_codon:yes gene_type:complete
MNKSNQKKTKSLNKTLTETMNTYDGSNYIYDGSDDTINTEQEMIKKYSKPKVQTWEIMKETADKKELRELRKIEKKMNYKMKPIKKSSIDQRRESSKQVSDTYIPLDISIPKVIPKEAALDNTLKRIEEDRNKVDPDFFRGIGTFLTKKI